MASRRQSRRRSRADVLRDQVLGVAKTTTSAGADGDVGRPRREVRLTDTRRGILHAVHAEKVHWHASAGWRCHGHTVNADMNDCVAAGWVHVWIGDGVPHAGLTDLGRAALGLEDPA